MPSWGPAPRWATSRSPERPTFGPAVAKLAKSLGKPLLPWQRYVVDVGLEVDQEGEFVYDEVIVFAQRRSGKTVIIEPVTFHRCGQPAKRSAWITAQKRDNAVKRWRAATDVMLESPLGPRLSRKVSHSFEELMWKKTGSQFLPFAPDEDSMHGEDPDLVWVDELWSLSLEQKKKIQQGYQPAWSVKTGQEWKMSAAGTARSGWMKHERTRGRAAVESGGRSRIAYFEWCVPELVDGKPVQELDDERLLQVVLDNHPRRDHGLRHGFLVGQLAGMGRSGFLRAYGGLDEDATAQDTVIPGAALGRALSSVKIPEDARVGIGVAVDPERREASVSAAWRDAAGIAVTEVLQRRAGTRWAAAFVAGVDERNDIGTIAVNNAGPARDVADELERPVENDGYGLELLRVASSDYAAACARFDDEITDVPEGGRPTVTHNGDPDLMDALRAANRDRKIGSGRAWGSETGEPISTLESHTLAVWAFDHMPAPAQPARSFRIF